MKSRVHRILLAALLALSIIGLATLVKTERAVQASTDTRSTQHQSILDAIDNKE